MTADFPPPLNILGPVGALRARIATGIIQHDDLVLMKNGERGMLNWIIRRAQKRMLRDLYPSMPRAELTRAAAWTHARCVLDEHEIGEMYHPPARPVLFEKRLQPGAVLLIRRPIDRAGIPCTQHTGVKITKACRRDIEQRAAYPVRELIGTVGQFLYLYFSHPINRDIRTGPKALKVQDVVRNSIGIFREDN